MIFLVFGLNRYYGPVTLTHLHSRFNSLLGMHCTCHRVFLATLIVAAKYLNDQSPKNKHWSAHSSVFSVGEVNLMEKQLLSLLDFDLRISETDLASSLQDFMQIQAASTASASAPNSTAASAVSTASSETSSRYASSASKTTSVPSPTSIYAPQGVPINLPSSNKRGSSSGQGMAEIHLEQTPQYLQNPQEQYKRRPSLPNQPCLEEGEVMPVYKGPIRNNQDQYPSPDGGDDAPLTDNMNMNMSQSYSADGYGSAAAAAHKAWAASTGAMYSSAPHPRLNMPIPVHHLVSATSVQDNGEGENNRAMC